MTLINIIKLTKKFFFIFRPFYTIDFQNIKICQKTPYVYHHVHQKNCGQNWPRSDPWVLINKEWKKDKKAKWKLIFIFLNLYILHIT